MQKLWIMGLAAALGTGAAHAADSVDGPRSLLITYRADPAKRPAFRHYLAHEELPLLARWKLEGRIQSYQLLFNPFVTEDTWDAMLVLRFKAFTDTQKWMALEHDYPGGLAPEGLALARPFNTYSADADWEGGDDSARADENAIFYVIPYEYKDEVRYRSYLDGYVLPQVNGWMREGVLSGYRIFMNRYPVGKPWDALFIYRYRDLAAFGKRATTVSKVRATLQSDAAWMKWSQSKGDIRSETENTIAEAIKPE